jgi:hypothetical protein
MVFHLDLFDGVRVPLQLLDLHGVHPATFVLYAGVKDTHHQEGTAEENQDVAVKQEA